MDPFTPPSAERMRRRDRFLEQCVRELLRYDERVRRLDLEVRFDGGVAHLSGAVAEPTDLELIRSLIGRFDGVLAVWDRVRVAGRELVIVDLGCGECKQYRDSIGVDLRPTGEVNVVADVAGGLPFADASVDRVFLVHVLEHLVDFLPLIDDVHRVLRDDGTAHVLSPWWRYVNAVADPTHVRLLDVQTIKGICRRNGSARHWYPLHAGCDGSTIFADLRPLRGDAQPPDDVHLARFFN